MKNKVKLSGISAKLMILIIVIIMVTGSMIGSVSYYVAKDQLLDAGESDLKSIVDGSLASLELLNERVITGELTLDQAKESARLTLSGPQNSEGEYDYHHSHFSYKEAGYLLAYDHEYVLQIHPARVGQAPPNDHTRDNRATMVEAGQANSIDDQYVVYADLQDDGSYRDKTAYMQYFEPWDWTIGMVVFQDEFYEDLQILLNIIIIATISIIIISSIVFFLMIRKKIQVLKDVSKASLEIAEGHVYQTDLVESKDEIGQLAYAFNRMSGQLHTLVKNVQQTSSQLLDSATDLSAVSEETTASSQEIGHAINEIATGTQEQANDLEDINSRVELLTKSIESMRKQNQLMDELTNNTAQVSADGSEIIMKLQQSNAVSLSASQGISSEISQLSTKIQEITSVMDTIENIAEETNLLALNASIEAARAGEHGKGFSVVASEIRKLAEQSKVATHKVQGVVTAIVSGTENTVKAVDGTMKTAEDLSADVIKTQSKFGQLSVSIKEIIDALAETNKEMDQISNHNRLMSEGIESASSVSEETAASVEEITSSIDEQINVFVNIANSAEHLTVLNEELNTLLKKYKIN